MRLPRRQKKKRGGRLHPYFQMSNFRDALDECRLMDLGFVGSRFTWFKKCANNVMVWERLDRAVASNDWLEKYPAPKVMVLECGSSDHKPILIHPSGIPVKPNKPWHFEQIWLKDEGCHDVVAKAWSEGGGDNSMGKVVRKVEICQEKLKRWSRCCFSNVTWEIAKKKRLMKEVEEVALRGGGGATLVNLKQELAGLLVTEEKLWQQRSKTHWMKSGDTNSRYFHNRASQRLRNQILGLRNSNGVMCMGDDNVAGLLENFYKELVTTSNLCNMEEVVQYTKLVMIEELNRELLGEFSLVEVDRALNQMAPLKAPRLDGLPPIFYQHYW